MMKALCSYQVMYKSGYSVCNIFTKQYDGIKHVRKEKDYTILATKNGNIKIFHIPTLISIEMLDD